MDPVARKKLNLEVLKRHDANICDILDQSPHCVVYKFDTQKNSWEKLGYEGVIFLTQGKAAPYFSLFVLNRLAIENFSLHLTDFEEINLNAEFIIYQTSEGEACALWLYEQKDRERIVVKIHQLHEGMKAIPLAETPQKQPTVHDSVKYTEEPPKVDILQMLKKATSTSTNPITPTAAAGPLDTTGNDLMKALNGPQMTPTIDEQQQLQQQQQLLYHQQQQQQRIPMPFPSPYQPMPPLPMHMNPPPPPHITFDNQRFLVSSSSDTTNDNNNNNNNSSTTTSSTNGRIMSNGELTKPFYPPYMSNSPAASPRNPGALLQTLHGGMVPMPPPIPPPYMMHQQAVMDLMVPEISRRFEGAPALSKPEFIQQVLNIVQCEPSFFDILYENYKRQVTPSTSSFK